MVQNPEKSATTTMKEISEERIEFPQRLAGVFLVAENGVHLE